MANALAIAGVTAVLKDLLNDGLINANLDEIGAFSVSSLPLDRLESQNGAQPTNKLNIYLWNVSRNPGWANDRLPARRADGTRIDNAYLALDLHYVLTAASETELNAEIMLGYGMQILHETPVLTRDAIRAGLGVDGPVEGDILPAALQRLVAADLADQVEQLRITPVPSDDELVSKIWPAFNTALRMSALYQVSVVLIESLQPVRQALPVLTLGGRTAQLRRPRIERIRARPDGPDSLPVASAVIEPGSFVAIDGINLGAEELRVRWDARTLMPDPARVTNARITLELPADLQAGVTGVQIEHLFEATAPGDLRVWERSNIAAAVVAPVIATVGGAPDIDYTADPEADVAADVFAGTATVTLDHPIDADQQAHLILNSLPAAPVPQEFAWPARPRAAVGTSFAVDIPGVPAGDYLVRARVDGAESALVLGAAGFEGPVTSPPGAGP